MALAFVHESIVGGASIEDVPTPPRWVVAATLAGYEGEEFGDNETVTTVPIGQTTGNPRRVSVAACEEGEAARFCPPRDGAEDLGRGFEVATTLINANTV
jgi:hypothetical protein